MIELTLIGIGTGNPDHVTRQAADAMRAADLILVPLKGGDKDDLAQLRRHICQRELTGMDAAVRIIEFALPVRDAANPDYRAGVDDWHDAIAAAWQARISAHLPDGNGRVALLVWGDPSLYDSTLRIAARVGRELPMQVQVIPGITAIQALCAAHVIPLNQIGTPVVISTGWQLRDHGWPDGADTVVVMLDGDCAFQTLDPADIDIWWGGFLSMPEQVLDCGPLAEAGPRIIATRAAARMQHGWIMDIYLMRRRAG